MAMEPATRGEEGPIKVPNQYLDVKTKAYSSLLQPATQESLLQHKPDQRTASAGFSKVLWAVAEEPSDQSTMLMGLSIHLATDRPIDVIREQVERWVQQQKAVCWRGASVTLREGGSANLHIFFYLPADAHKQLCETASTMADKGEGAKRMRFELASYTNAVDALCAMLEEADLDPDTFDISTAYLQKTVIMELKPGTFILVHSDMLNDWFLGSNVKCTEWGCVLTGPGKKLSIHSINPDNVPVIQSIVLWESGGCALRVFQAANPDRVFSCLGAEINKSSLM
jgi:hypothetical protein